MMTDEFVMVRPSRTYLEGNDLKSPDSAPYPVSRGKAEELRINGLAVIEPPAPAPAPLPEPEPVPTPTPAPEPIESVAAAAVAEKPKGRRRRAS